MLTLWRQGAHGLFSGHSQFYELLCLIIPILLLIFVAALLFRFRAPKDTDMRKDPAKSYAQNHIMLRYLRVLMPAANLLAVVGVVLTATYLGIGPTLYEDRSDVDPLLQTTIAPVVPGTASQCLFVLMCFLVNAVAVVAIGGLKAVTSRSELRASGLLVALKNLEMSVLSKRGVVRAWRVDAAADVIDNGPSRCEVRLGRILFYLGHIPLVAIMAAPTMTCKLPTAGTYTDMPCRRRHSVQQHAERQNPCDIWRPTCRTSQTGWSCAVHY